MCTIIRLRGGARLKTIKEVEDYFEVDLRDYINPAEHEAMRDDQCLCLVNLREFATDHPEFNITNVQYNIKCSKPLTFPINYGTMDKVCEHDIDKLYNRRGVYIADYCNKCKGVY